MLNIVLCGEGQHLQNKRYGHFPSRTNDEIWKSQGKHFKDCLINKHRFIFGIRKWLQMDFLVNSRGINHRRLRNTYWIQVKQYILGSCGYFFTWKAEKDAELVVEHFALYARYYSTQGSQTGFYKMQIIEFSQSFFSNMYTDYLSEINFKFISIFFCTQQSNALKCLFLIHFIIILCNISNSCIH